MLEAAETIGGGTRTSELTLPGLLHDDCSAVHPMAVGSPALLDRSGSSATGSSGPGRRSTSPTRSTAASAAAMVRSIEETAAGLGGDGERLAAALRRARRRASTALGEDILRPFLHVPAPPAAAGPLRPAGGGAGDGRWRALLRIAAGRGRCSAASPRTPSAR